MAEHNPVFVKIEEYKDVLTVMDVIKTKLAQAKDTLTKINQIKNEEDAELELWHNGLEDVEKKVQEIDSILTEPSSL